MSESTALQIVEAVEAPPVAVRPSPREVIRYASEEADVLAEVIEKQKLYSLIQGKKFVKVEGWVTLATLRGFLPREVSVIEMPEGRYVAEVELIRIGDGFSLTKASAECGGPEDPVWAKRPPNARRSMAITRATGKACRVPFSWVMALAGYEVTPAEEMPMEPDHKARPAGDSVADDGTPIWRGKVLKYDPIEGVSNGKPWKLHKFHCTGGVEFGTFHDTITEAMKALVGSMAEIEWEPAPKGGKNILRCAPLK